MQRGEDVSDLGDFAHGCVWTGRGLPQNKMSNHGVHILLFITLYLQCSLLTYTCTRPIAFYKIL